MDFQADPRNTEVKRELRPWVKYYNCVLAIQKWRGTHGSPIVLRDEVVIVTSNVEMVVRAVKDVVYSLLSLQVQF